MITTEIIEHIDRRSRVTTDGFTCYHGIGFAFKGGHKVVNHSSGEYVNPLTGEHTNTAESFNALLKRGHYGIFHQLSRKHLGRYCGEFAFRWNHRKVSDGERMVSAVKATEGKRLFYKKLTE